MSMKKIFGGRILTVPNLLSLLRLCLIPVFVRVYLVRHDAALTAQLLLISGATDVADGLIARRFQQVSDLGKLLDPLADKLTQAALLICLMKRFPLMLLPLGLLAVKELFCAATGIAAVKSSGELRSSDWHGKLAAVLLYFLLCAHLLWPEIPPAASRAITAAACAAILLSGALYGRRNLQRSCPRGETPDH